ncbi:MAG: Rpp14/Pop5 family protein [Methanomassiliicoccales archaeon]|nr:Rpp14/Pop5 family protein [Methanomassiliicoccales archaeon]
MKAKRGRRRYIAFITSPPSALTSQAFNEIARKAKDASGANEVKPIQHHGGIGIVRTSPIDQRKVKEALNSLGSNGSLGFEIETVLASGTLRTLRTALGIPRLPKDRNRRPAPRAPKRG